MSPDGSWIAFVGSTGPETQEVWLLKRYSGQVAWHSGTRGPGNWEVIGWCRSGTELLLGHYDPLTYTALASDAFPNAGYNALEVYRLHQTSGDGFTLLFVPELSRLCAFGSLFISTTVARNGTAVIYAQPVLADKVESSYFVWSESRDPLAHFPMQRVYEYDLDTRITKPVALVSDAFYNVLPLAQDDYLVALDALDESTPPESDHGIQCGFECLGRAPSA